MKESAYNVGDDPWVRKIPWRRAWQPTPVFLPGESPWTEVPGSLSGKSKNARVGNLSLLQDVFLTQELNRVPCFAGGFITS